MSVLRKMTWRRWIVWAENITVVLIISFAFYTTIPVRTTQTIFIPKGSINAIISHLTKKGYDLSIIDNYILRFIGHPQTGWINIGKNEENRIDFLYKLTNAQAKIKKVTLIPGETSEIFFEILAKEFKLDTDKLKKYYNEFSDYPEAGIYADTYYVPYGIKEKHLMSFLTRESEKKYKSFSEKIYGRYDKKQWNKVLVMASIIQKEAASEKEMPMVSSVIHNRLKKNMRLQMDGTLNYGKYSHIKVTPERIRNDTTPFNTYKHKGLPPSPIGAVSIAAIKAAIKPASSDYLYFMKNKNGVHDFSKSFKNHRKNIRKAK
ncbi:FIG004453: protein YceG like [hydrothermal vent metagenome]|uniref:FIG004453: protein YceG like n=1 Tax=hydrothermal vent metagenome TaxID=652676 RepID=A0A1W1ECR5_9ZZZZ